MGSIELSTDYGYILSVLNHPEMLSRITEYNQDFEFTSKHIKDMESVGYLLGWYVEREIKGFYWVHPYTHSILQIHAHFPIDSRNQSKGSGKAMLTWLRTNTAEHYQKYMATIPVCYQDVIGFSVREGLTKECQISKAFNKGGNMIDLCILGAHREVA